MNTRNRFAFCLLFCLIVVFLLTAIPYNITGIAVLDPKGPIGEHQRDLMVTATLLMMIVVIPVIILTALIAWRYREGNQKATYSPNWDFNFAIEFIWWTLPCAIILVLSILTWKSTHDLDPYKAINTEKKPLVIQVVALQWKWLFIYPEQKIASVNSFQFPEKTPIRFEITSDAPMNSFWIPQLGGQIYAMPGMKTQLYLASYETGTYEGSSANLSGDGFASMAFQAKACSETDFNKWVTEVQNSTNILEKDSYIELAKPSKETPIFYSLKEDDLFNWTIMKYMMHMHECE